MDSFIENLRSWLVTNLSNFMTNLVIPIGALVLLVAAVFCFITGIMKLRGKQDDFKTYFIGGVACIAGAVVLGSIWVWGRAAAGV